MPTPFKVLIVDDDADDKELFVEIVSEINRAIIVLAASNGKEALQLLEEAENIPDVIFLDLNMPRMNGRQCLSRLKQDVRLSSIPVIIYSTSNIPEDIEETRKLGAHSFITKPVSTKHLKEEINNVVTALLQA